MYRIAKKTMDELELLPDIVDTPIWDDYNNIECNKTTRLIANLYKAISERENYFQLNSPTAFGNPQYNFYCGVVHGFLVGSELEEEVKDNEIHIKKNNRTILVVDKIKRSRAYYESVKEIDEIMRYLR